MNGNGNGSAIRNTAAGVVTAVDAFAAVVSYNHIRDLGRVNGQNGVDATLLPLSVDGLILAASLLLLHEARAGRKAPFLARAMLGLGVAATVAANVAAGIGHGPVGAVVSAWPALALVGATELLMNMIHRSRKVEPEKATRVADVARPPHPRRNRSVPKRGRKRAAVTPVNAEVEFATELAAGAVPSLRQVQSRLHVGWDKARALRKHLESVNGVNADA